MSRKKKVIEAPLAHSTLGASTSDRWGSCPGSVRLCKDIPNKSSSYAEEGTRAHEAAATLLLKEAPKNPISDEMLEAVKVYVDLVNEEMVEDTAAQLFVEQRLDLSAIHPAMFGTADAVVYFPSKKLIRVYDYKHGAGVGVDAVNNSQLKYYGLGAYFKLMNEYNLEIDEIEMIIVQPRCYHELGPIRRDKISAVDLFDFSMELKALANATEEPNALLVEGDHCRWCPAAGICPQLHAKANKLAKTEFSANLPYDPIHLSQVLSHLDTIEAWAKSVREFAYGEAEHGRCPPGWKLVEKRATRRWLENVDSQKLHSVFMRLPCDFEDTSLKSPAQVEKIVGKKELAKLNQLCSHVSSGLALVPESDKREPAKVAATQEFTKIEADLLGADLLS